MAMGKQRRLAEEDAELYGTGYMINTPEGWQRVRPSAVRAVHRWPETEGDSQEPSDGL